MKIFSNFESGNIHIVSADSPDNIQLTIPADNQSDISQWFHFRLESQPQLHHQFSILNLAKSAYPEGWQDYDVVASYDREEWFRIPAEFDGDTLTFKVVPEYGSMYFAYFAPFSYDRHQDLLHQAQTQFNCKLETLGSTLDGNDMSLLNIGEPSEEKKNIWIIGRQHPGETMAEWFIEGLLQRLLDDTDTVAKALLDKAVFHIVPNMNPDGSIRGHLRTNAIGVNLNREWQTPSMEKSPEVFLVRERMLKTGVDMFLDIHGDEAIPYNFVAGSEGIPSYNERHAALENAFKATLLTITPEFQVAHGYDKDEPGKANLTIGSNWVAEQFKCLSYTIEMPFKDHISHPDEFYGWSPERSVAFGQDVLAAVRAIIDQI
ncbi:M14-type cytosolic carboxypeptidase [Photobacterium sp. ZSDE20]|uniref:M14-type cytosolic carboxypeptidase n=1 Tax=Photobacterium pectinilyticum TaxID=2906793 RepID=A0ABT1N917_9GAMM|nr:M14-type cytosolic carboxypeptidase [Photobacterium sp. ZSDE20]MCQ1061250.1 M14-type cytosolic carboxypeptidase [Photobacterium sp. ZSDE20]MDD1829667.1 M14-type cytosolic carboxypeptidase [Photobacterium sp. ZSDE20]